MTGALRAGSAETFGDGILVLAGAFAAAAAEPNISSGPSRRQQESLPPVDTRAMKKYFLCILGVIGGDGGFHETSRVQR